MDVEMGADPAGGERRTRPRISGGPTTATATAPAIEPQPPPLSCAPRGLDASGADLKLAPLVAKARLEASAAVGAVPAAVDAVPEPPEADVAMKADGRRDEASKEVPAAMEVDSAADESAAVEDANTEKLSPADVSVSLREFCAIAVNKKGRNKRNIVLHEDSRVCLAAIEDPVGAAGG